MPVLLALGVGQEDWQSKAFLGFMRPYLHKVEGKREGRIVFSTCDSDNSIHMKKGNIDPCIICQKMSRSENLKFKMIKLHLPKNVGKNLCGLEYAKFSLEHKKHKLKKKVDKWVDRMDHWVKVLATKSEQFEFNPRIHLVK